MVTGRDFRQSIKADKYVRKKKDIHYLWLFKLKIFNQCYRWVPPFSIQTLQKHTHVIPPAKWVFTKDLNLTCVFDWNLRKLNK